MLQMGGHTDVFFAGGLQIDRRGNCNLARSVTPAEKPTCVVLGPLACPGHSAHVALFSIQPPMINASSCPRWISSYARSARQVTTPGLCWLSLPLLSWISPSKAR